MLKYIAKNIIKTVFPFKTFFSLPVRFYPLIPHLLGPCGKSPSLIGPCGTSLPLGPCGKSLPLGPWCQAAFASKVNV